jgi:MarR family
MVTAGGKRSRMPPQPSGPARGTGRAFLTNHAAVLACVAADPDARQRDIAARLGIADLAVNRIVADLAAAGYLTVARNGRRRRYAVNAAARLRGPLVGGLTAGQLVGLLRAGPAR